MSHIATILLLGSGELGREFVIAAKRLGARVIACDAYDDAPAMQVADAREVFSMLDGAARLRQGEAAPALLLKHAPESVDGARDNTHRNLGFSEYVSYD